MNTKRLGTAKAVLLSVLILPTMTLVASLSVFSGALAAPVAITSYDLDQSPRSGFGCWSHTYFGFITNVGRTASALGYCNLDGNQLANYRNGYGTLNDQIISATAADNHLFSIGLADDGLPIHPVITLRLASPTRVTAINVFGGTAEYFAPPGALTGATVEIGTASAVIPVTPVGTANALGIFPDGTLNLAGTSVASVATTTIVLRDFTAAFYGSPFDQFSLTEITVEGTSIITVAIDIKPGDPRNLVELEDPIPVAILSTSTFNAPAAVFPASLTFGKLGTEASLLRCQTSGKDVNGDRLPDLVCIFNSRKTGLGRSDTVAMLQGATVQGAAIQGQDRISIDD